MPFDTYELIKALTEGYDDEKLINLFRLIAPKFRKSEEFYDDLIKENDHFANAKQLGKIEIDEITGIEVASIQVNGELTARFSKRRQYELAKRILKYTGDNAGIFAFYDEKGHFRLSLVTVIYHGIRRSFSTFRRNTFFVDPDLPNKTFFQQFKKANFSTLDGVLRTFSIDAVSEEFYKEFKPRFDGLFQSVRGTEDPDLKKDFALLFVIRTIFIGFVQKKGWLGNDQKFLQSFWDEYSIWKEHTNSKEDLFYLKWLAPLFFEALSTPPGRKVSYGHAPFSEETQRVLQTAPYLNGELFKPKRGIDDIGLWIPDDLVGGFFEFLFQYNFTVEENELYDEELELNPEFLGIIFERLTNMDQGAVYTPRIEVDMMSRMSLVRWLERNTDIDKKVLYRLFFPAEEDRESVLTSEHIRTLISKLENVTICDPAAGSGAFEVGMLQVLDSILEKLYNHPNAPTELKRNMPSPFERKKAIIARSLYGVDVKRWAVWINQLRLWLTLFVEMPDEFKNSYEPLLPNLTFKVRVGDSLVQRFGGIPFPVHGSAQLPKEIKRKITLLKQKKRNFYYNRLNNSQEIEKEELNIFMDILDFEIKKRIDELKKLTAPQPEEASLPMMEPSQRKIDIKEHRQKLAEKIKQEIDRLIEERRNLKEEHPFIWSIEFSEIFFDQGGFDIVVGNPPYVRQEEISDPNGKLPVKAYKEALLEMVRLDFPKYFKNRKPSGRSDLYTYFYIRSLRLLNEKGVHVFICSNAWLDVGYGAWLQEFFLRKDPLYMVIDNHARRSFARADINTVITVAGAPLKRGEVPKDHTVRFVAFKKPFEEAVNAENFIAIESAQKVLKTPDFRVFPITVEELLAEGSEPTSMGPGKYLGDKWGGKYLRAPDIFFTILERGKGKLVRLGEIAEVRFGIKTGANDFFYLEPLGPGSRPGLVRVRNGAGWEGEIEEEFLKPVIKSPREVKTIVIDPSKLKYRIFMCHKSKEELRGTKALEYIEWGENVEVEIKQGKDKGKKVKGFHNISTVKGRKRWWDLGKWKPPSGILPAGFGDSFRFFVNSDRILADKRLYLLYSSENLIWEMNSTFYHLILEIESRTSLGEGVLDLTVEEYKKSHILKPDFGIETKINRPIHSIFTEIGIDPTSDVPISEQEPKPLPDRKALDDIVFDTLGLTEEERKEVYRAVAQLVWERISKARSVRRKRNG